MERIKELKELFNKLDYESVDEIFVLEKLHLQILARTEYIDHLRRCERVDYSETFVGKEYDEELILGKDDIINIALKNIDVLKPSLFEKYRINYEDIDSEMLTTFIYLHNDIKGDIKHYETIELSDNEKKGYLEIIENDINTLFNIIEKVKGWKHR